ncbi:MAG: type II toxin-antitoxin system Phd/YefM family antitoxin [Clostridiales bacterium]|nr:type II toxin-antitoxin system Phd/YefM family antitoxin [Clostridiales bacterium]
MVVTATEFKTNLGKYMDMLLSEDIFITRNGKVVAKVVNPNVSAVDTISGMLAKTLPEEYDARAMKEERLNRYALDD